LQWQSGRIEKFVKDFSLISEAGKTQNFIFERRPESRHLKTNVLKAFAPENRSFWRLKTFIKIRFLVFQ